MAKSTRYADPRPVRTMGRILRVLKAGPLTRAEIAAKASISTSNAQSCLAKLMAEPRRVRVCAWVRTGGRASRQFELGTAPDAPFHPLRSISKQRMDMTEINCKVLVEALSKPQSVDELAESCRCSIAYVRKYMALLLKEAPRRIYVCEWRRPHGKGPLTKVYAAGCRKDVKRPVITASQRFQELKRDKDKHARSLLLRRLWAARRRMRDEPQQWFAALPGAQPARQRKGAV